MIVSIEAGRHLDNKRSFKAVIEFTKRARVKFGDSLYSCSIDYDEGFVCMVCVNAGTDDAIVIMKRLRIWERNVYGQFKEIKLERI